MKSPALRLYALAVATTAAVAVALLPTQDSLERPLALALLLGLSAAAGSSPVRFSARGNELTATHPVVLCALAALGAIPAVLTAIGGLASSMLTRGRSPRPLHLLFNLGNVTLSTVVAWSVFVAVGGQYGGGQLETLLASLLGATAAYYLVNTGLVAVAVSLERGSPLFETWTTSFRWICVSFLTAVTVAFAMLVALEGLGLLGIALGLPPILFMNSFYREHRELLEEKQCRIEDVERLNEDLREQVEQQQEALSHIERLQGLLPICMHCKSVRDDQDTWRRIESYLTEHSELRFTHSLCGSCRTEHYSAVLTAGPERS